MIKQNKKYFKLLSMFVILFFIFTTVSSNIFAKTVTTDNNSDLKEIAECNNSDLKEIAECNKSFIDAIEKNLVFDENGITIKDEKKILKSLKNEDIIKLGNYSKSRGRKYKEPVNKSFVLKSLKERLNYLNDKINEGKLIIIPEDKLLIDSEDNNFYLQGGIDKRQTYWWGSRDWMSTSTAWDYQDDCYKLAAVLAAGGTGAGILSCGIGVAVGAVGALYCTLHAIDVGKVNRNSSTGIIVDVNWAFVYSIYPQ